MTEGSPNLLAWAALALYAPFTWMLFARLRPHVAAAYGILGGALFLPEVVSFDPPYLPALDKHSITSLAVLSGCAWTAGGRVRAALTPRVRALFGVLALAQIGTAWTNPDALVTGLVVRPGLTTWDALSGILRDALLVLSPFVIGRAMFRAEGERRAFASALVGSALVYSGFALFELRMSPQSHRLLYGYHPASFEMTLRGGGYRPTIFMLTGLAVAMFFLAAGIAAIARRRAGLGGLGPALWLPAVLLACKSTGAIVYGLVALPLVAWARRPALHVPLLLGALVFAYPVARAAELVPTRALTAAFMPISEARALSLWFRFDNEDRLLDRALERPFFGWGTYGRQRVFDPRTGEDTTVTDGQWIIALGERGVVGWAASFGFLLAPLVAVFRARRRLGASGDAHLAAGLAMIVALAAVDLLPNGLFSTLPYVFAGALSAAVPAARSIARTRPASKRAVASPQPSAWPVA